MARGKKTGGRKPITAHEYEAKLMRSELRFDKILERLTRDLGRLKKARKRSNYLRSKITERS